jgi:F420-0:gamma-glutamyl ligase
MATMIQYRGYVDPHERQLESTVIALAAELAGAAEIVTPRTHMPVVIVRAEAE